MWIDVLQCAAALDVLVVQHLLFSRGHCCWTLCKDIVLGAFWCWQLLQILSWELFISVAAPPEST